MNHRHDQGDIQRESRKNCDHQAVHEGRVLHGKLAVYATCSSNVVYK